MALILKGRLAVVTGAGAGIGRALARELLKEGCVVAGLDRDQEALDSLKEETALLGFDIHCLKVDVSQPGEFRSVLEELSRRFGAPEIMINNAGIAQVSSFVETELSVWEKTLRVNLSGVLHGTYLAAALMKEGGGVIVNMASTAGHLPGPFMAAYCASKYAVVGLTRSLQAEFYLARSPVRVCLVSPGFVDTAIMRQKSVSLPWYLRWLVASPAETARAILSGIKSGKAEIVPDWGGRLMQRLGRLVPGLAPRFSRLLLARSLSQLLGREPIRL